MKTILFTMTICFAMASVANGQNSNVVGGQTSVLLDTATLSAAASLDLSSVSPGIGSGSIPDSVAFDINARDAASSPTLFSYTAGILAPFSGSIEHTGSVFFNSDAVEVGNFSIGFDNARVAGLNSGFFVESTTGIGAILFDVGNVTTPVVTNSALTVEGDLLVSPEFASFLSTQGLAASNLTGADVGDARVEAASVPEPSALVGLSTFALCLVRRRSRKS